MGNLELPEHLYQHHPISNLDHLPNGHMTGTADVEQSVLFGDSNTTEKTYDVGNSRPVAGNVYYNLVTLVNNASDKSAKVELKTTYQSNEHSGWWLNEPGITTSYVYWVTSQKILTGVRPTAVYNSTGDKKYEVWYKVHETGDSNLHYAYGHWVSGQGWKWDGADTNVPATRDCPFVMKEDGKYYMVNYGPNGKKKFDIYTSDDGINWTDKGTIYSYNGSWYKIDNPRILKDDDGYKMYFQIKKTNSNDSRYYIFLATSDAKSLKEIAYNAANSTESFKIVSGNQCGGSILAPGADGEWDSFRVMQPMVFKPGNQGYLMLYTGYDKYDQKGKIGYAVSNDGIDWTKIKVSKEGYDTTLGTDTWKTSVVKTNNNLVLFYQNGNEIDWTWLGSVVNSSNQMTIQPKEIKPFFIKNDFEINLKPLNYSIKTEVIPAQ